MKTSCRTIATTVLMAVSIGATAQEKLYSLLNDFMNDKYVLENAMTSGSETRWEMEQISRHNPMFRSVNFKFERSKADKLWNLRDEMKSLRDNVYKTVSKKAGKAGKTITVAYSPYANENIDFCDQKDRNYLLKFAKDPTDSNNRWCFALWWEEPKKTKKKKSNDDIIEGSAIIIYGPDPTVKKPTLNATKHTTVLPDGTEIVDNLGDKTRTVMYSPNNKSSYDNNYQQVDTSSEFLQLFGDIRTLLFDEMKKPDNKAMQTRLANKMLTLCKNKNSLLSRDERKLCRAAIDELATKSNDNYVAGLLKLAADTMK